MSAYVYRFLLDGRGVPLTLHLAATGNRDALEVLRLVQATAKRYGVTLEPVYPADLEAVEAERREAS